MNPNLIADEEDLGPQKLITRAPYPQLAVLAAGGHRAELLHSLTAETELLARGTARIAPLARTTYSLMYGHGGSMALQVVGDDKVHRAYSRGTAQTMTAQKTGLLGYSTLDTSTPMFHAKLAAMLPMLDLVERNGGDGPVLRHLGSASWISTTTTASPPTVVAALLSLIHI